MKQNKHRYKWFKVVRLEMLGDGQTQKLCETIRRGNHRPFVELSNPTEYFIRKKVEHAK